MSKPNSRVRRRSGKIEGVPLVVGAVFNGSTVLLPDDEETFDTDLNRNGYLVIRRLWPGALPTARCGWLSDEFVIVAHDGWERGTWGNLEGGERVLVGKPVEGERWICDLYFYPTLHGRAVATPRRPNY